MAIKVSAPVTIFKVSKALRISRKIIPRPIEDDGRKCFRKIFTVKAAAKNNEVKKGRICKALAWVKLSG